MRRGANWTVAGTNRYEPHTGENPLSFSLVPQVPELLRLKQVFFFFFFFPPSFHEFGRSSSAVLIEDLGEGE